MANKAIKYRVYPTTEQRIMFAKTFGCCRKIYNLMLSDKIEGYKATGKFPMVTPAKYKKNTLILKKWIVLRFVTNNWTCKRPLVIDLVKPVKRNADFLNSNLQSIVVNPILQTIIKIQSL